MVSQESDPEERNKSDRMLRRRDEYAAHQPGRHQRISVIVSTCAMHIEQPPGVKPADMRTST